MSKNALTVENLSKVYINPKSKKENKALTNLTFNLLSESEMNMD